MNRFHSQIALVYRAVQFLACLCVMLGVVSLGAVSAGVTLCQGDSAACMQPAALSCCVQVDPCVDQGRQSLPPVSSDSCCHVEQAPDIYHSTFSPIVRNQLPDFDDLLVSNILFIKSYYSAPKALGEVSFAASLSSPPIFLQNCSFLI